MMGKKQAYALIRDKDGRPLIDDPKNLHPGLVSMLTPAERREFGLWDGVMIRDAQGIKRAELIERAEATIKLRALEPLVAAGNVYVDGHEYTLSPRFDAPVDEILIITIGD